MVKRLLSSALFSFPMVLSIFFAASPLASAFKSIDRPTFKSKIDLLLTKYGTKTAYGEHYVKIGILHSSETPGSSQQADIYSQNALSPVKPASNLKLFTTMLALHKLGPDFKYQTLATIQIKASPFNFFSTLLNNDFSANNVSNITNPRLITLHIKGVGDSSWMSQFSSKLGNINGSKNILLWIENLIKQQNPAPNDIIQLYFDNTGFENATLPSSWNPDNFAECYSAETGAFNYENNCDWLKISPANKVNQAASLLQINRAGYMQLLNKTKTTVDLRLTNEETNNATSEQEIISSETDNQSQNRMPIDEEEWAIFHSNHNNYSYGSREQYSREWQGQSPLLAFKQAPMEQFENDLQKRDGANNCASQQTLWIDNINVKKTNRILTVVGEVPLKSAPASLRVAINNPTQYFSEIVQQYLVQKGFPQVNLLGKADFEKQQDPNSNSQTFTFNSPKMSDFIYYLNKVSQNHLAENIFRTLSYQSEANNSSPASWNNSVKYAQSALKTVYDIDLNAPNLDGLETEKNPNYGSNTIVDGSGLSHENRVTVSALQRLLVKQATLPTFETFYDSLPIAGVDGSLKGRMSGGCYWNDVYNGDNKSCGLFNNVRAKTGYISGVVSLTGYMQNFEGKKIAFSLVSNNVKDNSCALSFVRSRIHEQILAELYRTKL